MKRRLSFMVILLALFFLACRKEPTTLEEVIRQAQEDHVRESSGEFEGQCFTDADLAKFAAADVPGTITRQLRQSRAFLKIVLALQARPPEEQQRTMERCRQIYQPTWSELGRISSDGQTMAGQTAQKRISESITTLTNELLKLPLDELKKLGER